MDGEQFLKLMLDNNEVFESKDQQEAANNALLGLRVNKADWTDDSKSKYCEQCNAEFTFFFRRHHCRFCGRLLCDNCTKDRLKGQRICDQCVETYNHSANQVEWLKQAKEKEESEEHKKASSYFVSPCKSFIQSLFSSNIGNGSLANLNVEYQKERMIDYKSRNFRFWLWWLMVSIVAFHILNNIILRDRCSRKIHYNNEKYLRSDGACLSQMRSDATLNSVVSYHEESVPNATPSGIFTTDTEYCVLCIYELYDCMTYLPPFILSSLLSSVFLLRFPSLSYYMLRVLALLCRQFWKTMRDMISTLHIQEESIMTNYLKHH